MTNYARMYRLGFTPWERYGPAAGAQLRCWLERESTEREGPGRALDIGCGRGQFTPELVNHGWETVGVDLVPAAVEAARERGPAEATYVVGDAANLSPDLGKFDLFLDIGCFQGLGQAQQSALARGATALANPGATLLMLAFGDSLFRRMVEGVSQTEVEAAFQPSEWELRDVEAASTEGLGFPMNRTNPKWYRFRRISS
ncbi:class I SAM-dependent methyltransferase [Nocardiopsis exhalans]|uniref:Class I SAM-dependent methyltransferase n=1 Tax=Nocardiopsis exhalans TaxID=163604 RepID=A0ABY5D907_9ACTN|nr:class I SAM-dependent methyltransferase [Nocardiopsis exhalans]USY20226.1 class I SAM-dependent methyltransferase [Nocardiopsis exhalans]